MECLFCSIVQGKIPTDFVYRDEHVQAFRDINPQAPLHLLIIPREHISTINDLDAQHFPIMGKLIEAAKKLAKQFGYAKDGYRLVMNCNSMGGQTVFHIHLHLLAGRQFVWPPG